MKKNLIFLLVALVITGFAFYILSKFYKSTEVKIETTKVSNQDLIRPHSPTIGSPDSKVTLVEFLDPECEACRAVDPSVKGLVKEQFAGKVFYVVRYVPFHPNSSLAIAILEEAKQQGKYWESLSVLFYYQPQWGDHSNPKPELMREYVKKLGVEMSLSDAELLEKHQNIIETDKMDAKNVGVKATPTFFVNGRVLDDISYENLKKSIEDELTK